MHVQSKSICKGVRVYGISRREYGISIRAPGISIYRALIGNAVTD